MAATNKVHLPEVPHDTSDKLAMRDFLTAVRNKVKKADTGGGVGAVGPAGPAGTNGTNGTNGTVPPRSNVNKVTAALADLASEQGTVVIGKSFAIVKVVADRACRIRLYSTAAQRTADLSRPATASPALGTSHGVILDIVVNATVGLSFILSPEAYGANCEAVPSSSISYTITNLSGAPSTVSVTLTIKVEEA